jgi:hypothetical protein
MFRWLSNDGVPVFDDTQELDRTRFGALPIDEEETTTMEHSKFSEEQMTCVLNCMCSLVVRIRRTRHVLRHDESMADPTR